MYQASPREKFMIMPAFSFIVIEFHLYFYFYSWSLFYYITVFITSSDVTLFFN